MCDPITGLLLAGATSLVGSLAAPKPAKPPELPAITPDGARAPGATVHVGDGQTKDANEDANAPNRTQFVEQRLFGRPVGGLGKSGLAI